EVNPRIRIIGVQMASIASMKASRDAGAVTTLEPATTLADGIAVKRPGDITFPLVQKYVDDIVTVDDEEIANAILLLLEREKTVVEGAGAAPLAALLNRKIPKAEGKKVGVILTGGNIDVNTLSRIIERGLVKDGRLVRLHVKLPDRPGALARFTSAVAEQRANVLEIYHNRAFSRSALGETEVELTLETRGPEHIQGLKKFLESRGYSVREEL
ncbi:MAG: pyridoxal-phosphate dependent enzyme, partial [Myxococcales bacterium]